MPGRPPEARFPFPGEDAAPRQEALVAAAPAQQPDEVLADAFQQHLSAGRLALAFQPIVASRDSGRQLYHEALVRIASVCADGPVLAPGAFIQAMERIGRMRHFDRCVVASAVGILASQPALRLGCNISAQSVVADSWWEPVFETLAGQPGVAARLVVEITESAMLADIPAALAFVGQLRALGCRIAVDDFGTGYSTLDFCLRAGPDIIKVDRGYLRRGQASRAGRRLLGDLVRLCASLAPEVVIEGVESGVDLALAADSGAAWVQGHFIAWPRIAPDWHDGVPFAVAETGFPPGLSP